MTALSENLERLEVSIVEACRRAGRPRVDVQLMAVSKTYPAPPSRGRPPRLTLFEKSRPGVCRQGAGT